MIRRVFMSLIMMFGMTFSIASYTASPALAAGRCDKPASALDIIPRWYKYLEDKLDDKCNFKDFQWNDIWKIALAVIEMLLRLAGVVAFVYVIIGGFRFVLSKGNPQDAAKARQTIVDAIIGMVIAMIATLLVSFIGRTLTT